MITTSGLFLYIYSFFFFLNRKASGFNSFDQNQQPTFENNTTWGSGHFEGKTRLATKFSLVSLFNDISIIMNDLMPNPSL